MKKTFEFGKIRYTSETRRINQVTVEVELRSRGGEDTFVLDRNTGNKIVTGKTPVYWELSICGDIWNRFHTDIVCGGQCLDTIAKYKSQLSDPDTFELIYGWWKHYHLNGMHAGTPEQEVAVEAWEKAGHRYDYAAACEMLKECGLYEVTYTGLSVGKRYDDEPYKYGHDWLVQELPSDVIAAIRRLLCDEAEVMQ